MWLAGGKSAHLPVLCSPPCNTTELTARLGPWRVGNYTKAKELANAHEPLEGCAVGTITRRSCRGLMGVVTPT